MVIGPLTPPKEIYPRPDWRIKTPEDPKWLRTFWAAERQYNPVFSMNNSIHNLIKVTQGIFGGAGIGYDPTKDIPDDLVDFANSFTWDRNPQDVALTARELRKSMEDYDILDRTGWMGWSMSVGATLQDPIQFLIPSSFFFKAVRGGTLLSRLGRGAAVGVGATLASEPFLQMGVPSRTAAQAGIETLSAGILGGILGGAFGKRAAKAAEKPEVKPLSILPYDSNVKNAMDQSKRIISNILFTNSLKYNQRWHSNMVKGIRPLQEELAGLIKERELLTNPYTHNAKSLDRLRFRKLSNQINELQGRIQQIVPEFPETLNINFAKYNNNSIKLLNDHLNELANKYSDLPEATLEDIRTNWRTRGAEVLPSIKEKEVRKQIIYIQNQLMRFSQKTQATKRTAPQDLLELKKIMGVEEKTSIPDTLKVNLGRIEKIDAEMSTLFQKTKGVLNEEEAKKINTLFEERDFLYDMRRTFLSNELVFTTNVKNQIKETAKKINNLLAKRDEMVQEGSPLPHIQALSEEIAEKNNDLIYLQKNIYPGELPKNLAQFNPDPTVKIQRSGYEYNIPGWIFDQGMHVYNSEGDWLTKTVDEILVDQRTAEIDSLLDSIGEGMKFEPSKYSEEMGETLYDLYQKDIEFQKNYPERFRKPSITFRTTTRVKTSSTPRAARVKPKPGISVKNIPVPESKLVERKKGWEYTRVPIVTKLEQIIPEGGLKIEGELPKPKKPRKPRKKT